MGWLKTLVGGGIGFAVGGPAGAAIGAGIGAGADAADVTAKAAGQASAATSQTAKEARELNIERYGEAREMLDPYVAEARLAREQQMIELGLAPGEAGTAYMETPGYKAGMKGVEQQMSQAGTLYSGARIGKSEQAQGQFYQNYMNMLQNLGSPGVATNLASLGTGQAATIGQQDIQAQQVASGYQLAGAGAKQAFVGDVLGGAANIYGGYLASQRPQVSATQPSVFNQPQAPVYAGQPGYI